MTKYFMVDTIEHAGVNWLFADFGLDQDGKHYILTSNNINASAVDSISDGARGDCELVARLLNAYYNGEITLPAS